jgi:hypothetical protein
MMSGLAVDASKLVSVLNYDGLPITADTVFWEDKARSTCMRRLATIVAFVFFAATISVAQSTIRLEIGRKLPNVYVTKKEGLTSTAASQLRPFIKVLIKGIHYKIAYEERTRRIKYIYTNDENFRTLDGAKVDDDLSFTVDELDIHPYWEIRGPKTSDGWYPVIAHDEPMLGGAFIQKLKKGERATMSINGFSKGSN